MASTAMFRTVSLVPWPPAEEFGKLIFNAMPVQLLSSKKVVYQAYVCAFFTAASEALLVNPRWEIKVECPPSRSGCLDLIIQHITNEHGAIQQYKRIKLFPNDKNERYGLSQRKRLTKEASEAMVQLDTGSYRARIRDHVTELHEYGVVFLGSDCVVGGHLLTRKPGGQWEVKELYTTDQDEGRRSRLYGDPPEPPS